MADVEKRRASVRGDSMTPDLTVHIVQEAKGFDWVGLLKILGATVAFGIGLWQYRKNQAWKRVEFVASEMKAFFDDEAVKAAMTMLDWRRKEMELFRYRGHGDSTTVEVSYDLVAASLGTDPKRRHNKEESAVREIFDRFLSFLERFEGFIETGVVTEKDLKPYLHYWTRLLSGRDERSPEVTEKVLPELWKFIGHYGYENIVRFVDRYDEIRPELKPASSPQAVN
jgi:hypothetical protein